MPGRRLAPSFGSPAVRRCCLTRGFAAPSRDGCALIRGGANSGIASGHGRLKQALEIAGTSVAGRARPAVRRRTYSLPVDSEHAHSDIAVRAVSGAGRCTRGRARPKCSRTSSSEGEPYHLRRCTGPSPASVEAPRAGARPSEVQPEEAIERRQLALVEDRPETPGRVTEEIGDGHFSREE